MEVAWLCQGYWTGITESGHFYSRQLVKLV
ncbi:MAG: hypothetical protein ACI9FG_000833 [Crocinitomicaceae bacterium]|jgi:hypothetical protein